MKAALLLLVVVLPTASCLTNAEAVWWANYAKTLPLANQKGATYTPASTTERTVKQPAPAYQSESWWEGESFALSEEITARLDSSTVSAAAAAVLKDDCTWGWNDECDVEAAQTLLSLDADCDAVKEEEECKLVPEYMDVVLDAMPLPCVTSEEECDLEAGAGIVTPASFQLGSLAPEVTYAHPCWWDEGCESFPA